MIRKSRSMASRILVHFYGSDNCPRLAKFTESIVDTLGSSTEHVMPVYAELKDDRLVIGAQPFGSVSSSVNIKRPTFCPIHLMTPEQTTRLPEATLSRGIDSAAAILVESSDNKVLLQRRATHVRTFPNVWVPPGGHVDSGETLTEAGLRELREETGLALTAADCVGQSIPVVTLWESTFPPKLSAGQPKRHHAIVYLYARLTQSSAAFKDRLRPDPEEVGACAWIDRAILEAAVQASNEEEGSPGAGVAVPGTLPAKFSLTYVHRDGRTEERHADTAVLFRRAPESEEVVERLSTGTKYALQQCFQIHR